MVYQEEPIAAADQGVILRGVHWPIIGETRRSYILTPTCDFAQEKASAVAIVAVFWAYEAVEGFLFSNWAGIGATDGEKLKRRVELMDNQLSSLKGQIMAVARNRLPRYHFLPPLPNEHDPLMLDFQVVSSIPLEAAEGIESLARLESPYRQEVSARYASYMGRVGTPDFSRAELDAHAEAVVDRLFPPT